MDINDTVVAPKKSITDLLYCISVLSKLIKDDLSPEEMNSLRYVDKTVKQSMELFSQLQNELNKLP